MIDGAFCNRLMDFQTFIFILQGSVSMRSIKRRFGGAVFLERPAIRSTSFRSASRLAPNSKCFYGVDREFHFGERQRQSFDDSMSLSICSSQTEN